MNIHWPYRLVGLLALLAPAARAQCGLDWYTFDGGGATRSTGGAFELSGTIGQPDAGAVVLAGGPKPRTRPRRCLAGR